MQDLKPAPEPTTHRRSARSAALVLTALLLAPPALVLAQSRGHQSSGSQVRSSTTTSGSVGRYRAFGQHRGATQAPPQRQPFLQPSLSGIRPEGFGRHLTGTVVHHPFRHAPIHHPVIFVGGTLHSGFQQTSRQEPPVIVVQAPPPQQPVVVVVPSQPAAPQPAAFQPAAPRPEPRPTVTPEPAAPREPGTVELTVVPATAEVFLDDRLLGTALEVGAAAPRRLSAGVHVLEVVDGAYPAERLIFGVAAGGRIQVEIDLTQTRPSRRTRLTTLGGL